MLNKSLITLVTLTSLMFLAFPVQAKSMKSRGDITSLSTNSFVLDGQTINISPATKMMRKFGGKALFSEFSVGDNVLVVGSSASASLIRNFSIQKRYGTFFGEIISLEPLTIKTLRRGNQNITPTSSTTYVNRQEAPIIFSSLQIGHRLRVKGLWDSKLNTITEVAKIKDYSLPLDKPVL